MKGNIIVPNTVGIHRNMGTPIVDGIKKA